MKAALSFTLALLVATSLGACSPDSYVILDVDGDCDVLPLGVSQLKVTLQNQGRSDNKLFSGDAGRSLTLPVTLAVVLGHDRSGPLTIQVDGFDNNMMIVASGSAGGSLQVGARTNFFVQLTAGARTCGNGVLDPGEGCDDGNRVSGDGCDFVCRPESGPVVKADAGTEGGANSDGMAGDAGQGGVVLLTPGVGFLDLAAGVGFTCASRVDGSLYCWGDNSGNQLAVTGTKATYLAAPARVPGSLWQAVSAGQIHACATGGDGSLACWGGDDSGQLGDNKASKAGAKAVLPGTWASVGAGYYHTCATKADNSLWCWGQNFSGQLGDGTTADHTVPNAVVGTDSDAGVSGWKMLSVGYLHNCAISLDTALYCWGGNGQGQLGLGTMTFGMQPSPVGGGADWTTVSAGYQHTCGIRGAGSLWCWGDNGAGQLGGSASTKEGKPVQVGDTADWIAVSAGQSHTCAIKIDGSLWCWGDNSKGQLGLGDGTPMNHPMPTQVNDPAGNWYQVAAGAGYTCGIQSAGSLWCWGDNSKGQLGDGSTIGRTKPILVSN